MWKDRAQSDKSKIAALLGGIRVLEYGSGVAAAYAAKLLADLGAEVIKVEPPQGDMTRLRGPFPGDRIDPEKSALFLYLNTGKRGVTLDLAQRGEREKFERLLDGADIFIHNVHPAERSPLGLESTAVSTAHPGLVTVAISPFGESGPLRDWQASDLNIVNAGGWGYISPRESHHPELPPLKMFGEQGDYQAGTHACFAALGAYRHRTRAGEGQAVEVSQQETIAAMLEWNFVLYTYTGRENSRTDVFGSAPARIMQCKDGDIYALCLHEPQWQGFLRVMGEQEWTKEGIFADRFLRGRNADALYMRLSPWMREQKVQQLFHLTQKHRVPFAPVSSMKDLLNNEHLSAREFFVRVEQPGVGALTLPGVPFKTSEGQRPAPAPAPRLGQHNNELTNAVAQGAATVVPREPAPSASNKGKLPLDGIRVLDFTWAWAGPYCTLQLAHLGAEVIKVESMKRPDGTRTARVSADDQVGWNRGGYFNQYSQGKRSIALNLATPEGVATALELARHCDLAVDNFAAGTMERLGLGYQQLRKSREDIIVLSMSGCGSTGPYQSYVSYGPPIAALAGIAIATGYPGGPPEDHGISICDPNGGIHGAIALMAALRYRERTGRGQFIDLSQFEAAVMLVNEGLTDFEMNGREPQRAGDHDRWMAPHNCYKSLGDYNKWISIAVRNESEWRSMCGVMGRPELASDPRFATAALRKLNESALDEIVTSWTERRDRWEVARDLQSAGVAAFPSMSNKDLATCAHLIERGFLVQLEHPEVGRRIHCGIPWKMQRTPCAVRSASPIMGADTEAVLDELLGYSKERIDQLKQSGALR